MSRQGEMGFDRYLAELVITPEGFCGDQTGGIEDVEEADG